MDGGGDVGACCLQAGGSGGFEVPLAPLVRSEIRNSRARRYSKQNTAAGPHGECRNTRFEFGLRPRRGGWGVAAHRSQALGRDPSPFEQEERHRRVPCAALPGGQPQRGFPSPTVRFLVTPSLRAYRPATVSASGIGPAGPGRGWCPAQPKAGYGRASRRRPDGAKWPHSSRSTAAGGSRS